ncbi:MAG: acetolactate synthase small subunit [Phycisphaerae bacterium]
MRHVISALVVNEPGVLANVAGMFAARGFNIDSLVVGRTEDPVYSRMTVVVDGDTNVIDQVRKQLAKLVAVTEVVDLTETEFVERDLMLVRVTVGPQGRGEVLEIVRTFRGKVVDVAPESLVIELTGTEQKLIALAELLKGYGVEELARTGVIGMPRGMQPGRSAEAVAGKRTRSLQGVAGEALPPS